VLVRPRVHRYDPETGLLHAIPTNLTLINVALLIMGPCTEKELGRRLCIFQALCCALGFLIRYQVAEYFF
jgi:UDP-N-acetylglucosamine--dolichyl-phosphate N-acetylglucosaminephosphotransferase